MKPRYERMEIAIMLDSNENAFMVDSEEFGKIYFLRLGDDGFPSNDGEWKEVNFEKWSIYSNALVECGYAVIYRNLRNDPFQLDAIFDLDTQFKRKLIYFLRFPRGTFNKVCETWLYKQEIIPAI